MLYLWSSTYARVLLGYPTNASPLRLWWVGVQRVPERLSPARHRRSTRPRGAQPQSVASVEVWAIDVMKLWSWCNEGVMSDECDDWSWSYSWRLWWRGSIMVVHCTVRKIEIVKLLMNKGIPKVSSLLQWQCICGLLWPTITVLVICGTN